MPPPDGPAWWQKLFARRSREPATNEALALPDNSAMDPWENPSQAIAFGQRIIFYGVAVFLVWAALAPLDEGVPAPGAVAVESGRKTISPLISGLVATLHISENQRVKAGDVLLTLENTQQQASHDSALQQHFATAVRLARLEAELLGANQLQLPTDLESLDRQSWARKLLGDEVSLLASRNETTENELAIFRERLAASEERVRGARQQVNARKQQQALLAEQVRSLERLVEAGHSPRNQLLETQRTLLEISRMVSELETAIAVNINSSSELRLQLNQRRKEIQRDLEKEIVETRRALGLDAEKLKSARDELDRTVLKAPIDGQVVALQGLAPGSAVGNGGRLMEIIPEGDRLLVDVQVAVHLIDRVHPGLEAEVRINAFPEEPQLVIKGNVLSVSGDQLFKAGTQQPYYLARIEITPEGLQQLGQRKLRPGMPVEAIVKTGERSFLSYLVKPFTQRLFSAFREH